jgi:hypothetical protein
MDPNFMLPILLMVFPVWLVLVIISYLLTQKRHIVLTLVGTSVVSLSIIALLKTQGLPVA